MSDQRIRAPYRDDLPAITATYNDVMHTSFTIRRDDPTSLAEREAWLDEASHRIEQAASEAQSTLRTRGARIMVAGIDSENDGSLRFHARARPEDTVTRLSCRPAVQERERTATASWPLATGVW